MEGVGGFGGCSSNYSLCLPTKKTKTLAFIVHEKREKLKTPTPTKAAMVA